MRARRVPTLLLTFVLPAFAGVCGGSGGDKPPTYSPVSATVAGTIYTLQLGDLKMVVDGARGARITEFSLFQKNALVTRDQNSSNYGSTYWPSPQSSWCTAGGGCWPPPAAVDSQAYTGTIDDALNSIQLTSAAASIGGIAESAITVSKTLTPAPDSGAIDVTYTLTNTSPTVAVSVAPWQISRVAPGGLTLFGAGSVPVTYTSDSDPTFVLSEGAGDVWYASAAVNHNSKAFADGTGWLAQVTPDRLLLVQSYTDIAATDAAPGEAEIEVFTNGDYVEIEDQGALTTVAPGATLTWTVRWKLRRAPGGTPAAGDGQLAALVSATLAE